MRYNWTNRDLRRDINALERMYKEEQDPKVREQIAYYLIDAKDYLLGEECLGKDDDEEKRGLDELTRTVPIFKVYYPYIREFRRKLDRYIISKEQEARIDKVSSRHFSKDDIMDLVNEVYKSVGGYIYDNFSRVFSNRYKNIRYRDDLEGYANMIFIAGVNHPYMTLEEPKDEDYRTDILAAVHELGHGTGALINPERYYANEYFFNEIETTFMELVAQDFLAQELKDKGFYQDAEKLLQAQYLIADDILENERLINLRYRMGNPSEEDFMEMLDDEIDRELVVESEITDLPKDIKYLFSYMVAIELYEVYKKDKQTALEMLNAMMFKGQESELTAIRSVVTPNKSLIKYKNYISKKNRIEG